jgi:hypothetical protein
MSGPTVDPGIVGARFRASEFSWTWETTQLIARAAGCSIADVRDRPVMLPESEAPGHMMIPFNGALLARNRPEVMERLIGGYDVWQRVGRWGSAGARFSHPVPRAGSGRVRCGFTAVGVTSKGHALVRFEFEVDDVETGACLATGWMLLFLLGCGTPGGAKITSPGIAMPERDADAVVLHETPLNVTFDWAMASCDWNPTHFDTRPGNPAPLVHGPRNMTLVLHDVARLWAGGDTSCIGEVTLGSLPAPHYPPEPTETHLWRVAEGRVLARLVVPAAGRTDGGTGDKTVVDQIEVVLGQDPRL